MPRKIRAYKAELKSIGFLEQPDRGKGSHQVWTHPMLLAASVIAYKDGDDVPRYLEKQLRQAKRELEENS
jgi:predicted RNA binding protein YcfA (HicA-like mRNA interferase family)